MAKRAFRILLLLLLPLIAAGCLADLVKQPDIEDPWPNEVEFFPTAEAIGQDNANEKNTVTRIELVGPKLETDQNIYFSVNSEESNAIAGRDYVLRTSSPVTIEAGKTTEAIEIRILPNSIPEGVRRELVIDLEGNDRISTVPSHDRYTLTIVGN